MRIFENFHERTVIKGVFECMDCRRYKRIGYHCIEFNGIDFLDGVRLHSFSFCGVLVLFVFEYRDLFVFTFPIYPVWHFKSLEV